MATCLNRATLIGYLGRDPEMHSTKTGGKLANLSVATSESWRDKASGERKERTEWHRVVIYNDYLAELAGTLHKGQRVFVEGAIRTRKWTDQSGTERSSQEICLSAYDGLLYAMGEDRPAASRQPQPARGRSNPPDDDIPF